jgi:serine/threonine-protein kinase
MAKGSAASRVGQTLAGKYRLDALLGAGGMGEVYRAENVHIGRPVAIKMLHEEHAENQDVVSRFLREARAANIVRHPNVVDVLDIGQTEAGAPFIVQELLEGQDLATYTIGRGGRLGVEEALDILQPVVDAVGFAHERGVIHRDLKPENIFLARGLNGAGFAPKLLDFGVSRIVAGEDQRMTATGVAVGTPAYMSPEQIRCDRVIDARTDVWSIGVILHELLSGQLPFQAEAQSGLFVKIVTEPPIPLQEAMPGVPMALAQIVDRCLRASVNERYANARELAADLRSLRAHGTAPGAAASSPRVDARASRPDYGEVIHGRALVTPGRGAVPLGDWPDATERGQQPQAVGGSRELPELDLAGPTAHVARPALAAPQAAANAFAVPDLELPAPRPAARASAPSPAAAAPARGPGAGAPRPGVNTSMGAVAQGGQRMMGDGDFDLLDGPASRIELDFGAGGAPSPRASAPGSGSLIHGLGGGANADLANRPNLIRASRGLRTDVEDDTPATSHVLAIGAMWVAILFLTGVLTTVVPMKGWPVVAWASQVDQLEPWAAGAVAAGVLLLSIAAFFFGARSNPTSWGLIVIGPGLLADAIFLAGFCVDGLPRITGSGGLDAFARTLFPWPTMLIFVGIALIAHGRAWRLWATNAPARLTGATVGIVLAAVALFCAVQVARGGDALPSTSSTTS